MDKKNSWKAFFDAHASVYDENCFTQNTLREVDFLLEEFQLERGACILDIGCGTGRHSIELVKRGYRPTGLDLSSEMLAKARAKADAEGVHVKWIQADAARFTLEAPFDAAICLCEGAFGLLSETDDPLEQPLAILSSINRNLKMNAKALFTVLNGLRMIRSCKQQDVEEDRFDPLTITQVSEVSPREGHPPLRVKERAFVPAELVMLFRQAGMNVLNIWGGTAGSWRREKLNLDEFEIMVVAQKIAEPPPAL